MQLHQIKIKIGKSKKRIGRGGKRGTYSGRGNKGQKSRAGRKMRPEWRDLLKKIPKLRGYKFKPVSAKTVVLNLARLDALFKENEIVSIETLLKKGLIAKMNRKTPAVKILGDGEINKKLVIKGLKISVSAKGKIEKAGGEIK
jgi:large subunit ribosomal protein L15